MSILPSRCQSDLPAHVLAVEPASVDAVHLEVVFRSDELLVISKVCLTKDEAVPDFLCIQLRAIVRSSMMFAAARVRAAQW